MISRDGQVQLMEGMGIDGDLVTIIRRIHQEANRNQSFNTSSVFVNNTSNSTPSINNTHVNSPVISTRHDLSLIESLTEDQVKHLLTNEEKFRKFLTNYNPIFNEKERFLDGIKEELKEIARNNINLKKEIDYLSTKLGESHEKYYETLQSYQNFLVLNSSNISALNPENLLTQIQLNLMELNDLSSESIKNALNSIGGDQNNLDLELKECVKMRKEYHKRAILLQKLQQE